MTKRWLIADKLLNYSVSAGLLWITAAIILFGFLDAREIWTQEHRWADIVSGMFYRHDFFHPYLGQSDYYDKPLLSYWLIALFAKLCNGLTAWSLRLPSAFAGFIAIISIYHIGKTIKNHQLGLLAGWLLLTTYYFVFWARTSSADMLNLAGALLSIAWYLHQRDHAKWMDYAIFFTLVALTSLCKGLGGAIIPLLAVAVDMTLRQTWRQHLRWPLFLALIPALLIYFTPFFLSSYFNNGAYNENGLYLVYRENILRYFQPFDHQGPIYTYFIYLPIYALPWSVLLFPAIYHLKRNWRQLSIDSKWIIWTLALSFLFFTLSGSRRHYYVLPLIPFAILFIADWLLAHQAYHQWQRSIAKAITLSGLLIVIVLQLFPAWYTTHYGTKPFSVLLKNEASQIKPWHEWNIVVLDAQTQLNFYLGLSPDIKHYMIKGQERTQQTQATLLKAWPILADKPTDTIFLSRQLYAEILKPFFLDYRLITLPDPPTYLTFNHHRHADSPIAFIPKHNATL